jgi:hypothetical protein
MSRTIRLVSSLIVTHAVGVDAGRFNFTAEAGAGVLVRPARALGVTVGYKLEHISNGGTRRFNPDIDNNLFRIGLVRTMHTSSAA